MSRDNTRRKIELLGPLEEEVDFFFSSFFGASYPSIYRKELCWKPPTDVYETESDFVIVMELAQMNADDVSITFQEGVLYIRGVRKAVPPNERRRYHKMEINYGPFERRIVVPLEVEIDDLKAEYSNGFLEVRLPKKELPPSVNYHIEVE